MINLIKNIFSSKKQSKTEEIPKEDNYFDIFVSLDKSFNINVLIYMNDSKIEIMTENDTALIYHEFLNSCFTQSLQNTILQILDNDIKDDNNKNLVNKIISLISYKKSLLDDSVYIKPSQVFAKYSNNDIQ